MIKTKVRMFNISSSNAVNGSFKSVVNVSLPDLAFHHEHINTVYLMVDHCEIPNSFYIVNYTNNILVVNNISYTVPVGNYNVNSLITVLQSLLPTGFNITYNSITNKYTFNYTSSFTINANTSTINKVIGLGVDDLTGLNIELPYLVNFLPIPRLSFHSTFLNTNNYSSSDGSSDVFLCLQNNVGQLSTINYTNQTQTQYLVQEKGISSFTITVTDDLGRLINFNNIDWYMTFLIKIEYVDNTITNTNFNDIIKQQAIL
jgi:hypothetical protein